MFFKSNEYRNDIKTVSALNLHWDKIAGKSILISGATGMIGSFLVDVLLTKGCDIYALGRSEKRAKERFSYCWDKLHFVECDINDRIGDVGVDHVDYIVHLASNTHPVAYATDPVGTITANILGTKNMLDFAVAHSATRSVFASSCEIYGENRGDVELFDESYCGYINSNTLRAGYPESKRCGEALCQAYIKQYGLDSVIPRLTRSYGPTLLKTDTKALSQFLNKGINGEDIVLKSEGKQYYSYTYVADAVSGLLTAMLVGKCGEAYNIADERSDITLRDLAQLIADYCGTKVVFELPNAVEAAGFSKATKARLDAKRIKDLGWSARFDIKAGIERTIRIIKEMQ